MSNDQQVKPALLQLNGKPIKFSIDWSNLLHSFAAIILAMLMNKFFPGIMPPVLAPPTDPPIVIPTPPTPTPPVKPIPKVDPVGARVKVRNGNSFCTGSHIGDVVGDGYNYYMTASHCTGSPGSYITVELLTKERVKCKVIKRDTNADISICKGDTKSDYPILLVSKTLPDPGTKVWHKGYGVDRPDNIEKGTVHHTDPNSKQTEFRLSVSSGDSGSPICREDNGEIVGVVCCTSGNRMWGGNGPAAWSMILSISDSKSRQFEDEGMPSYVLTPGG